MLTIVINYVCDCTIWGYYPLGIPAVLTAQYIILNLKPLSLFAWEAVLGSFRYIPQKVFCGSVQIFHSVSA